jgi:hypothetical protein
MLNELAEKPLTAVTSVSLDVVKQYAPVLRFHPNEKYFPCSIEFLLQNGWLRDNNNKDWNIVNPAQTDLQQYCAENYYVQINPSQYPGMCTNNVVSAPLYYAVQEFTDIIEITYIFLYAYQGGQTVRALRAGTEFNCIVNDFGIHQGDLETIVVRLVPQGTGGYSVLDAVYSAHGNESYLPTQRIEWSGTHPVVDVALNLHGSYSMKAQGDTVTDFEQPGILAIIDSMATGGVEWATYNSAQVLQLGLDNNNVPVSDQVWAAFAGRLGIQQTNSLTSATYFDGSNLKSADWTFVKMIHWTAELLNKYPDDIVHGNGPTGPGNREWIRPGSGQRIQDALIKLQAIDNVGQGSGAIAWLAGDITVSGQDEIIQLWNNNGSLGMIIYGIDDTGNILQRFASSDMGQGYGAIGWFAMNVFGDHRKEVIQLWNNNSRLGIIMYGADINGVVTDLWSSTDMGQGSGAAGWLKANLNGDQKEEIIQLWDNSGALGMIVYGDNNNGGIGQLWATDNMGQGPGAEGWLVGDLNGDGKDEIIQLWDNHSSLGIIMYGSDGSGGVRELWSTSDMGQGSGAVAWLMGDVNGDGKDEIIQLWGNGSSLGMIVYGDNGQGGIVQLWATSDMGQGPGAVQWFAGDINGDGKAEIVQAWGNGSSLGMIVYGDDGNEGMKTLWATADMGEGPGAVGWLMGDFKMNGNGKKEIIQLWNNKSSLGIIEYGTV